MSKLYRLVGDFRRFEEAFDDYVAAIEAGEMDESFIWDTLDAIEGEIADKADRIVQIIRNKQTFAASIDAEIKRLRALKKSADKGVDKLAAYLGESLSIIGMDKLDTPHARLSFRSSEECEITDAEMVVNWALANGRAELLTIPAPEPRKEAIKSAIKNGETVPGAGIVKNRNLQIK